MASRRAAAAAAAHEVLQALFPAQAATFARQLDRELGRLRRSARAIERGRRWGARVGQAVLAARANDGSTPRDVLPGRLEPGRFRADFRSAQFRNLAPFGVADPSAYVSGPPPALSSRAYRAAWQEVRFLGDGSVDDPEKLAIVRFWAGSGGSARPPGEWFKVAAIVAEQTGTTRSLARTAHLFALLGIALGDAAPVAWSTKFRFRSWRPATAIQNADQDGNRGTVAVPDWRPRNGSIGGSPEYTSGQSTFAGAGSTVLAGFFCRDDIAFTFTGDPAIAGSRTFPSFSAAANEAGRARIFAGIHFEFSNQAGLAAGRALAREILARRLRRPGRRDRGCQGGR